MDGTDRREGEGGGRSRARREGGRGLHAALLVLLLAAAAAAHGSARRHAPPPATHTIFQEFPVGDTLRGVTLGYTNAVADALWLQAIQYFGGGRFTPEGTRWAYHVLEAVTSLDPRFRPAFEFSGIALGLADGGIGYSNRLLLKGIARYPGYWRLPFLYAYNRYFEQGDAADGARWMARAASLPGAPPYLPLLASRMFVEARTPAAAVAFLNKVLEGTTDPSLRKGIEARIVALRTEEGFVVLEEGVRRFRERFGRPPDALSELVASGVMRALPPSPVEGRYYVEPGTGKVRHTVVTHRMKLFLFGGGKGK
jgi:hypothetical protein